MDTQDIAASGYIVRNDEISCCEQIFCCARFVSYVPPSVIYSQHYISWYPYAYMHMHACYCIASVCRQIRIACMRAVHTQHTIYTVYAMLLHSVDTYACRFPPPSVQHTCSCHTAYDAGTGALHLLCGCRVYAVSTTGMDALTLAAVYHRYSAYAHTVCIHYHPQDTTHLHCISC